MKIHLYLSSLIEFISQVVTHWGLIRMDRINKNIENIIHFSKITKLIPKNGKFVKKYYILIKIKY